jgi:hypothetical protein
MLTTITAIITTNIRTITIMIMRRPFNPPPPARTKIHPTRCSVALKELLIEKGCSPPTRSASDRVARFHHSGDGAKIAARA